MWAFKWYIKPPKKSTFCICPIHTHARTHARSHARTHARTHAHTHTLTHTHTHTHTHGKKYFVNMVWFQTFSRLAYLALYTCNNCSQALSHAPGGNIFHIDIKFSVPARPFPKGATPCPHLHAPCAFCLALCAFY